jgi:hypothetical protein
MTLLDPFHFNNVLVTLDIIQNTLSVRRFTTDNWCSMEFNPFDLSVNDLSTWNVITRCDSLRPLYTMHLPSRSTPLSSVAAPTTLVVLVTLASTLCPSCIMLLASFALGAHMIYICHTCQLGRHTRMPFVSFTSRADNNFDLIHYDLWTSPIVNISGCKYYLVILDDRSHFV